MKNKGFTLVEVLGTLLIITAVALITTPAILSTLTKSKKETFEININGYMEAVRLDNSKKGYGRTVYTIEKGKVTDEKGDRVKKNGGGNEFGTLTITEEGDISLAVHNNKWCAVKTKEENKIRVVDYKEGECTLEEIEIVDIPETCFTVNPDDQSEITGYTCEEKAIIIPNTIGGVEIKKIGFAAFARKDLKAVTLPNGVTSIGAAAFRDNQITSITIPNSVVKIEASAFFKNQLSSVKIPTNVTEIGNQAFNQNKLPDNQAFIYQRKSDGTEDKSVLVGYGGVRRENVKVPENVTSIAELAFSANQLISITIPNGVTSIGERAFYSNQLTSIIIPNSVTSIGADAFRSNTSDMKVIVNKQEGSIEGAPWRASSVEWTG